MVIQLLVTLIFLQNTSFFIFFFTYFLQILADSNKLIATSVDHKMPMIIWIGVFLIIC